MNFQNCTINSTNDYNLQVKNPIDNKLNVNYSYKNQSVNTLPLVEYNLFNKSLLNGTNKKSDISNSSISRKSLKIKNKIDKISINQNQGLNWDNIDELISRKTKIFEALENLLINDKDNNDNDHNDNDNNDNDHNDNDNNDNNDNDNKYNDNNNNNKRNNQNNAVNLNKSNDNIQMDSNQFLSLNKYIDNMNMDSNKTNNLLSLNKLQDNIINEDKKSERKEQKSLSTLCIPKLDLSDIVSEYETNPLYIHEVKYISNNRPKKRSKKKKKTKIDNNIETYS